MQRAAAGVSFVLSLIAAPAAAQNPCSIITKAEAEALVGTRLEGPQLSPGGSLCKFLEPGYDEAPAGKKLVTIGIFRDRNPDPEAVNKRRQFILQDQSLLPVSNRDVPSLGDAAIWVWAGGYFGALYAFKEGTTEVTIKIAGLREAAALAAARRLATKALGGAAKSGYRYGQVGTSAIAENYNAPGILGPLYLGTFDPIPDDEMSRNYVISLVQAFNASCESVPETFAIMDYGFYYASNANRKTMSSARAGNLAEGFESAIETMRRAQPHMLEMGHEDAATFLELHKQGDTCYTRAVEQLYDNIAKLATARRKLPPDVPDYAQFLQMLSPAARKQYAAGFENQPSRADEARLRKIKEGCLTFVGRKTLVLEAFCRCHTDAARQANLDTGDQDLLGAKFNDETLNELSRKSRDYDRRKNACYT